MMEYEDLHKNGTLCLARLQEAWMRAANFDEQDVKLVRRLICASRDFEVAVSNMGDPAARLNWRLVEPLSRISEMLYDRGEAMRGEIAGHVGDVVLPVSKGMPQVASIKDRIFGNISFAVRFRFLPESAHKASLRGKWGPIRRLPKAHAMLKPLPHVRMDDTFRSELVI